MTEYQKWQRMTRFVGTDAAYLPEDVQAMMNEIPAALKKAAEDAGIVVLGDMTSPIGLAIMHGTQTVIEAKSRLLGTPGENNGYQWDTKAVAPSFYEQFLNEFTMGKDHGLKAVAFYHVDVMKRSSGFTTGSVTITTRGKVEYGYVIRYATV